MKSFGCKLKNDSEEDMSVYSRAAASMGLPCQIDSVYAVILITKYAIVAVYKIQELL